MIPTTTSLKRKSTTISFGEGASVASEHARHIDLAGLPAFAAELARMLRPGDAVALHGELGAGKTTLVRALVAALHGDDGAVSSPTFVFRQRYDGEPPIEHLDLYRLDDPAEGSQLGLEEAFGPATITVVEWAERWPALLPADAIHVTLAGLGNEPRRVTVERPA
jgi:tRNA threonylcarbamoyladenosine biosynthesis protein TsaE